jgi:rubrerythrin
MKRGDGLRGILGARFLDRLVGTRRGHAFLLTFLVDAEEADEKGVFDQLLARVDDPELHKLVRIHRDDETVHGERLRACLDRIGARPEAVPEGLHVVPFIDRAIGGVADGFVEGRRGVMEAYLLLQVLEERAVVQYPLFARALERVDPESAQVVREIADDERRHVRYAIAVSRRYAPDAATLSTSLARYRAGEARAFREHGRALIQFAVDEGLLAVGAPERFLWRMLAAA